MRRIVFVRRQEKMYCMKCGSKVEDGTKFCANCGTPVSVESANSTYVNSVYTNPVYSNSDITNNPTFATPTNTGKTGKDKKRTWLGITIAVVFGLVAILYFGGIFICDNVKEKIAKNISEYNISDYMQKYEHYDSEYNDENYFNLFSKIKIVNDVYDLQKKSEEANEDLIKKLNDIEKMESAKESYNLAESYAEYEDALKKCKSAIENREYENSKNTMAEAENCLRQLISDNEDFVKEKLELYEAADWSMANSQEKDTYNSSVEEINKLLKEKNYNQIKSEMDKVDDVACMYIKSDNPINVNVQQVDVTSYPNVKLYVQMEDVSGEVPENLEDKFFYVRKQDANASYIRQKVSQVVQLNQVEGLKIDMVADVSGSMSGYPLNEAKRLMSDFIGTVQFNVGDKVELTSFSTGVYLEEEFTDNADVLNNTINNLVTDDMTSLYDALYTAVTRTAVQNGAKCVIAFTDGEDNYSNCTPSQVISTAKRYSVPIFIIGIGEVYDSDIRDIAQSTGGSYYSISDITSIKEVYDQIYKQEKELYLIEYLDETGASVSDISNIRVGYHSKEFGGEQNFSYTPKVLMSVNGNGLFDEGPESTVEGYMRSYGDAMTESDFSYIKEYLKPGSEIYKTQKKYVEKEFAIQLETYEIDNIEYMDDDNCVVTTRETYYVQKEEESLDLLTQQCQYKVENVGGEWKMTDFVGEVKILSRIKQ